jgi:hydroxyacylglutathione hydrolase
MLYCTPIPALKDNYIWLFKGSVSSNYAYIVDPSDAMPAIEFLDRNQLILNGILVTHHHNDHTAGVSRLVKQTNVPVYGPKVINCVTHPTDNLNYLKLAHIEQAFSIIAIPGHTLEHIAFYGNNALFCGDTLFAGGCGRVFEGTHTQMLHSLKTLSALPDDTQIYCAHEYTLNNLKFAQQIEPSNVSITEYQGYFEQRLATQQCTLPSKIKIEHVINPFLRCNNKEVIESACNYANKNSMNELEVFTAIRNWKNHF